MPQRVRDTTLANPRLLLDLGNLAYPRQNRATLSTFSTSPMTDLPIHAVLPDLLSALNAASNAVLVAPPGAGKTTAVAPALLDQDWCTGEILLLSPRRLAARAAAERVEIGRASGREKGGT